MTTRFFFDPSQRPKPKVGPNLKSLLVRCPSTSKLTAIGRTVEEKRWSTAKLKAQKFTCAYCGSVHTWTKNDVILGRRRFRVVFKIAQMNRRGLAESHLRREFAITIPADALPMFAAVWLLGFTAPKMLSVLQKCSAVVSRPADSIQR